MFLSNVAGFFGKLKEEGFSLFTVKIFVRTNLRPLHVTIAKYSWVRSKYTPFIAGRNKSCAVAKRDLLILSAKISLAIVKVVELPPTS